MRGTIPYCIAISVSKESDIIINMEDAILLKKGNGMISSFLNHHGRVLYGDEANLSYMEI